MTPYSRDLKPLVIFLLCEIENILDRQDRVMRDQIFMLVMNFYVSASLSFQFSRTKIFFLRGSVVKPINFTNMELNAYTWVFICRWSVRIEKGCMMTPD